MKSTIYITAVLVILFFPIYLQLAELVSHTQLVNRHLADLAAATAHITHAQTGSAMSSCKLQVKCRLSLPHFFPVCRNQ